MNHAFLSRRIRGAGTIVIRVLAIRTTRLFEVAGRKIRSVHRALREVLVERLGQRLVAYYLLDCLVDRLFD